MRSDGRISTAPWRMFERLEKVTQSTETTNLALLKWPFRATRRSSLHAASVSHNTGLEISQRFPSGFS